MRTDADVLSPRACTPRWLPFIAYSVAALTVVTLAWQWSADRALYCGVAISRLADINGRNEVDPGP